MKTRFLLLAWMALALTGCQKYIAPTRVETGSIPDRIYEVTVHESNPLYYAVLFDIPDDGMEVVMFYTYFTHRIGRDTPEKYINRLNTIVKGYRTLQIRDEAGTVRAYLAATSLVTYSIYERRYRKQKTSRIIVQIDDPNLGGPVLRRSR
ncbi:MAG: hypothetical protein JRH07_11275 [Deltaproteobacteria bacterium]|nr:hypothetical protein [Deltaproteobacteria bacterium]MBW2122414.1 hypothetical protein [Deltaproteobacteria bacterium]